MFFDFNELSTLVEHVNSSNELAYHAQSASMTHGVFVADSGNNIGAATNAPQMNNYAARAGAYIGAGLAMTGALGVGIGQGYVGGKAALATAKNPDEYSRIRAMMLIGAAIAESSAIYALIIAILLIFVAPSL